MRENAGQIRGLPGGALRASRTTYIAGPFGLSLGAGAFLAFVGAFGTADEPFWPRMLAFLLLGLGGAVLVAACLWVTDRIGWLMARPLVRRGVVALALTPLVGGWVWIALAFAVLRRAPRLADLPVYLGYSLVMSFAMTALSWAIFRKRDGQGSSQEFAAPAPRFLDRLPLKLREAELYAVEADDHYLRVRTSRGSDLILMRLSDALQELRGVEGARTHRSWWVARAALADVRRRDGRPVLVLKDGAEVPISRTYAKGLREAGWL